MSDLEFIFVKVSMVRLWSDTDRIKPKYSETNLPQCHFLYRKSHMDWTGIEFVPPRWEAATYRHGMASMFRTP